MSTPKFTNEFRKLGNVQNQMQWNCEKYKILIEIVNVKKTGLYNQKINLCRRR